MRPGNGLCLLFSARTWNVSPPPFPPPQHERGRSRSFDRGPVHFERIDPLFQRAAEGTIIHTVGRFHPLQGLKSAKHRGAALNPNVAFKCSPEPSNYGPDERNGRKCVGVF